MAVPAMLRYRILLLLLAGILGLPNLAKKKGIDGKALPLSALLAAIAVACRIVAALVCR